jgi:hypothetical protein
MACGEKLFAGLDGVERVADLLSEIQGLDAGNGMLDRTPCSGLLSSAVHLARRELCEHYNSLILEDAVIQSPE